MDNKALKVIDYFVIDFEIGARIGKNGSTSAVFFCTEFINKASLYVNLSVSY